MERVVITGMGVISRLAILWSSFGAVWRQENRGLRRLILLIPPISKPRLPARCRPSTRMPDSAARRPGGWTGSASSRLPPQRRPGRTPVSGWRSWTGNGWASMWAPA